LNDVDDKQQLAGSSIFMSGVSIVRLNYCLLYALVRSVNVFFGTKVSVTMNYNNNSFINY